MDSNTEVFLAFITEYDSEGKPMKKRLYLRSDYKGMIETIFGILGGIAVADGIGRVYHRIPDATAMT